jgi:hypothetical protein
MKMVMVVAEVVMGAVMMLTAPGIGSALLVGIVGALETLQTADVVNVVGYLTDALAKAIPGHSQILADSIVAVAEVLLTVVGGAGLDLFFSVEKVAASVAEKTVESSMSAIEQAAGAAVQAAGKAGDAAAQASAVNVLENVCEKAAQKAVKGAAAQFMKQEFATLVALGGKGALEFFGVTVKETFKKALEATIQRAATEAIETAIEDAAILAKLAASGIESIEDVVEGVATRAANETVSSLSGKSLAKVTEEAEQTGYGFAKSRAICAFVFAYSNTNMITEMFKKMGVSDGVFLDKVLPIIQQLIQMIALMVGSGMLAGATLDGVLSKLPRGVSLLSLIPQGAESASSYGLYGTQDREASAVTAISMEGSVADLLHSFIEQLQKDANLEREIMTRDQTQEAQSTLAMAGHLHDGDNAAIQILISAAG